jgi:hypothetical protein
LFGGLKFEMKSIEKTLIKQNTLRINLLPFYIMTILYLSLILFYRNGEIDIVDYILFGAALFFPLIGIILYKFTGIKIEDEGLVDIGLFRDKKILWNDIVKVNNEWHSSSYSRNISYSIKLTFNNREHYISLSDYSRKNIQILCQSIVSACPNAEIFDKVDDMAEGKFPWYIF